MSQLEQIVGIHAVKAILKRQPECVVELWCLQGRQDREFEAIIAEASRYGASIQYVSRRVLDERTQGATHQGVLARVKPGKRYTEHDLASLMESTSEPLLLVLDGVTDPHNLGACLRTADAAGVSAVIVPKDKSAQLNATVRKVACGAAETMPLIPVTNLARSLRWLQQEHNVWVLGTAGEADHSLYQSQLTGAIAVVMGAEGKGMRRLTRETCDELVKLPMAGSVSSLNVSVATGICLYEAVRQRTKE